MLSSLLAFKHDLQTTPSDIVQAESDVVDACMSDAAKGAAYFLVAVSVLEALVFYGLSFSLHKRARGFHYMAFILQLAPAIAYMAMLSGYGIDTAAAPFAHRCFWNARWSILLIEVPLLIVTTGLFAGLPAFDLTLVGVSSFFVVLSGFVGGLVNSNNRWFFFIFAVLFSIPIIRSLWNRFYTTEEEQHEYSGIVANRLSFLCSTLLIYLTTTLVFWILCQGANVMSASTELLILGIVDVVFISAFNIALLSDRETTDKMSEFQSRSMGWLRSGGSEYSSIEERGAGSGSGSGVTGKVFGSSQRG